MKNLLLVAALLFSAGVFAQSDTTKTKKETKEVVYSCPMHSDVASEKAGKCPHCDMKLTKADATTKYCCPKCDWTIPPVKGQCAESTQSIMKDGELKCVYCHDKSGKCTKCGGDMEKIRIRKAKDTKKG